MVDALGYRGDEGRGVPAISFGEVASNLWSGDFRMGKPGSVKSGIAQSAKIGSRPGEAKHHSTQRKKEQLFIPLVVASEKGRA